MLSKKKTSSVGLKIKHGDQYIYIKHTCIYIIVLEEHVIISLTIA